MDKIYRVNYRQFAKGRRSLKTQTVCASSLNNAKWVADAMLSAYWEAPLGSLIAVLEVR